MKPISDEELQEVRGYVERAIRIQEIHNLLLKGPCAAGLLARLDAAESRVAELQREVERLRRDLQKAQETIKDNDECEARNRRHYFCEEEPC